MPKILSALKPDLSLAGHQPSRTSALKNKKSSSQPLTLKRLDDLGKRIRICVKCLLHESRNLAVPGEGKATARFMVIGEAPGKQEDEAGRPFIGNAGRYLDHVLEGTELERSFLHHQHCEMPSALESHT